MGIAQLGLLILLAIGVDEIAVRPGRGDAARPLSVVETLDRPGDRTLETLRRYDLATRYKTDPENAIGMLELYARRGPNSELVFALAELSWIEGKRGEARRIFDKKRRATPQDRFLDTVAYTHDFLFDPILAAGRPPSDPRYRLAMDLYNAALERLIRIAKAKTPRDKAGPGERAAVASLEKDLGIGVEMGPSAWKAEDVDELLLANEFEVSGLDARSRHQYGLGVPLIAVRRAPAGEVGRPAGERFFPPMVAFPLTAFLRPNSKLKEAGEDVEVARPCTLLLADPVQTRSSGGPGDADGPGLALESDLTTPLAYMWSETDLNKYRWKGLIRPGDAAERAGLMLLRPYEADKIPVVLVHGLMSTPLAWIPMVNELLRDPEIGRAYQFFLYVYPTGLPVPVAAAGLREALTDSRKTFETVEGRPTFERMVLLGHSMGGLLAHATAVRSGKHFWGLYSDRRFDDILGPTEALAEFRHYTFFEPLPFVRRVVFLATPHRGSDLARSVVGRLGSNLIGEPDRYTELLNRLIKDNPDAFDRRRFRRLPTSIDSLEPPGKEANILSALLQMERSPDVAFHSIIGSNRPGPVDGTTDGVVPYRSSHLDGVASELVVRSDHGVQKDPEAILEVRRILREHLGVTPPADSPRVAGGLSAGAAKE